MKAILVIDVPNGIELERYRANVLVKQIIFYPNEGIYSTPIQIPFCSLHPLPKQFGVDVEGNYAQGWNDCIEEIEKC